MIAQTISSLPALHHNYMVPIPGLDLDVFRIGRRAGLQVVGGLLERRIEGTSDFPA